MSPDPPLPDDVQCMNRLKAGDDLALNDIMARWQTPLVSFILRYTGNEADARDLAQETFVRVYESRDRYQPGAKFSTWLYTIATNLCRNLARWRQRHPTVPLHGSGRDDDPGLENTLAAADSTPADHAALADLASAVRAAVQMLPHDLKTTVLLFEYQELGYDEIAVALACSPKAVETRLYRARKILREALGRFGITG